MNFLTKSTVGILLLSSTLGFAKGGVFHPAKSSAPASPLTDESLMAELTGKKVTQSIPTNLKNAPLPVQHYFAGQRAAAQKNYILAIKHFNTVIQKYPNSKQVPQALVAKAQVYKEMGLQPQAERNLKLAQLKRKPITGFATVQDKNKTTK